ncbi:Myosin heavy chain-related protein, putative isoform 1 [Theobroma cacao]|uniref:Myosin heavy chain-related protein, putative isoform 1 n=1 Tax=Theobroma cacao TaxID=3641 RepID=A0A061E0B4_THECC|nr:Myosin heavy chain-related protein, putative isoform 1 [Theobroma cacao]
METSLNDNESLLARIQQLEHERDELRKDIEQLCMQQAGPSYLAVATRMHFQRTAGLEQEIESLKKRLASCTRENQNLQEELSEVYRIKTQLADLHRKEAAKNVEAEKQVKFFQGCVAAAFAERDHSIMEAEKAKEKEELMAQKFNEFQTRLEELTSNCLEQSRRNDALQIDLAKQEDENESLRKVIDKFYEIRQQAIGELEDASYDEKCTYLLHDPAEMWSFNDSSTSKYISFSPPKILHHLMFSIPLQSSLEEELERVRSSVDDLRNKLRVGLEIENHLKKKVHELGRKKISSDKMILNRVTELRHYHSQHRTEIMNLLDMERSHIKRFVDVVEEKFRQFDAKGQNVQSDLKPGECECGDVYMSTDAEAGSVSERDMVDLNIAERKGDSSEALAQALQEKVAALLLLSQQEERHLLERNVHAALQKKIEELQRNLLQLLSITVGSCFEASDYIYVFEVTNEKVKALLELAQLKRKYQLLQEKISNEMKQGNVLAEVANRRIITSERDGRLRNLLKKTYLRRWVGAIDARGSEAEAQPSSMDFARMRIENATLRESMGSLEHLTSAVHRLRLSLLKVTESITSEGTDSSSSEALDEIVTEAKLVKTALGSSLPVSWSAEGDGELIGENAGSEVGNIFEDSSIEKIDSVSAAGFEMVDLLILAAQILKERTRTGSLSGS